MNHFLTLNPDSQGCIILFSNILFFQKKTITNNYISHLWILNNIRKEMIRWRVCSDITTAYYFLYFGFYNVLWITQYNTKRVFFENS